MVAGLSTGQSNFHIAVRNLGFLPTIILVAVLAVPFTADAASFIGLGDLPGGILNSSARGVSSDGSVVVGSSASTHGTEAFRWTSTNGMVSLGDLPGGAVLSQASGVSADGSVVVGLSQSANGNEAFRWTSGEGIARLGDLPTGISSALVYGISGDGTVVVGQLQSMQGSNAFRWGTGGNLEMIAGLSTATAASADGSVVVGQTFSSAGFEAFRWTSSEGMVRLGNLPGGKLQSSATGVSSDGSVVVGQSSSPLGFEAFRWTKSRGMVGLGDLPGGHFGSAASGVSADGQVVIGYSTVADGTKAFIWDSTNGMRDLQKVLETEYGLRAQLAGWTLTEATAISADGSTVVGTGSNPAGHMEAWRARLTPELSASLTWDRPTDPSIYEYRLYYGKQPFSQAGFYPLVVRTLSTTALAADLESTRYYFAVTSFNGRESIFSSEVCYDFQTGLSC